MLTLDKSVIFGAIRTLNIINYSKFYYIIFLFASAPYLLFYVKNKEYFRKFAFNEVFIKSISKNILVLSYLFSLLFILPFSIEEYSVISPEGTYAALPDASLCPEAPRVVWIGARAALLRCEANGAGGKIIILYGPENLATVEHPSLATALPAKSMLQLKKSGPN